MALPRPPDWILYALAVGGLALVAVNRAERSNAPGAPPPVPGAAETPLPPDSPFNPKKVKQVAQPASEEVGTAFSINDKGVWLTAAHVVRDCRRTVVMVADRRGVLAHVTIPSGGDVAVLRTEGGAPALPLAPDGPDRGQRAFHPGFPQARPGEAATRFLGPAVLPGRKRGTVGQKVLAWAEVGRTEDLKGGLEGLSGAPVLDRTGQVIGVTLAESPRRARIYSSTRGAIRTAMDAAGVQPAGFARGQAITTDNYGRVADSLRRDIRVAQVVCLS